MDSNDPSDVTRLLARTLYDGTGGPARKDVLIELTNGKFSRVEPWVAGTVNGALVEHTFVCPGLIDLQINGANDVLFNDTPTPDALGRIAAGAARGGTAWILPTFMTAPAREYCLAIDAARAAIAAKVPGILGLHLEGPFISAKRPGIHEANAIRHLDEEDLAVLAQPFPGPLLVTVAPEEMPEGAVDKLAASGVTVFAGHSEATWSDIEAARKSGLKGATHLFNAMSQMTGREPGVVGAILGSSQLYSSIIADGHHVHWNNVAIAARMIPDRLCLVTDAMCTLAGTRTDFDLHGERIFLANGRLTNAAGTLAGAQVAMDESIRNLLDHGIAGPAQAVRMASRNPAAALGLDDSLGVVKVNGVSGLSTFDEDWRATGVIRGGYHN